jgi:hypothetical protein
MNKVDNCLKGAASSRDSRETIIDVTTVLCLSKSCYDIII